jgi:hypothetical protein
LATIEDNNTESIEPTMQDSQQSLLGTADLIALPRQLAFRGSGIKSAVP